MMDVSLGQIRIFRCAAERCNYTRAAEDLYMTQPAVSLAIGRLEQTVGTRLFDHVGREVHLTAAGILLLEYARRIADLTDEAQGLIRELQQPGVGCLHIGANCMIGTHLLPPLLTRFRASYPQVSFALHIGNAREIVARILQGHLDLGITAEEVGHSALEMRHVFDDELVVIVSANHPLAKRQQATLSEIISEPFVVPGQGSADRTLVEHELDRLGLRMNVAAEISSNEAIKCAVQAGLGISLVSDKTIQQELKWGTMARLHLDGSRLIRRFYAVRLRGKQPTRTVRDFMDFVVAEGSATIEAHKIVA